jgi:class 3 adenylate cyclase
VIGRMIEASPGDQKARVRYSAKQQGRSISPRERTVAREVAGGSRPGRAAQERTTFLVADVSGYATLTEERADEAAARLGSKFATPIRLHVEARGPSPIGLRRDEALAGFRSLRRPLRAAIESRFLQETQMDRDIPLPVGIGLDVGGAVPAGEGDRRPVANLMAGASGEAWSGKIRGSQALVHVARTVESLRRIDRGDTEVNGSRTPSTSSPMPRSVSTSRSR